MVIFLVILIAWLGALVRTVFGFGEALVSMPLLALIGFDLPTSTALIGAIGLLVALPATIRSWNQIDFSAVKRLITGSIFGIPLGILMIKIMKASAVFHILGTFLIIYGCYSLWQSLIGKVHHAHFQANGYDYVAGLVSGMLGSAYNSHGVPVAVYGMLKQWSPTKLRAVLQAHFLVVGIFVVSSHVLAGFWSVEAIKILLMVLPGLFFIVWLGNRLVDHLDPTRAIKLVYVTLIIFGGLLLFR